MQACNFINLITGLKMYIATSEFIMPEHDIKCIYKDNGGYVLMDKDKNKWNITTAVYNEVWEMLKDKKNWLANEEFIMPARKFVKAYKKGGEYYVTYRSKTAKDPNMKVSEKVYNDVLNHFKMTDIVQESGI